MATIKFSAQEKEILTEIRRRIKLFKNGAKDAPMVFLGYPSEVKSLIEKKILTPYSNEIKRALNWYNLTKYGQSII